MEYKHGVYGEHIANPGKLGDSGATNPVYIGTAPVWQMNTEGKAGFDYSSYIGKVIQIAGLTAAKKKIGYSSDLAKFGICEAVYMHFVLRGTGPILIVNVADPTKLETAQQSVEVTVTGEAGNKTGYLKDPLAAIEDITVTGVDSGKYTLEYVDDNVKITVTDAAFSAASVTLAYKRVDVSETAITTEKYQEAVDALDYCYTLTNRHPNLLVSPQFSCLPEYHKILVAKANAKLESKWGTSVLSDIPSTSAVNTRAKAITWKSANGYTDKLDKLFWPCCIFGEQIIHASTAAAAALEDQDAASDGVPYVSLDNKDSEADGVCLEDGSEVLMNEQNANEMNAVGITTLNVVNAERRFWGGHMANYSVENTDTIDTEYLQDTYIRMNIYLDNYRKEHFADEIGHPIARRDIDATVASMQQWLNSLVADGKMLYATVDFLPADNTNSSMASGDFVYNWAETYVPNAKSITHRDHYTAEGLSTLLGGED